MKALRPSDPEPFEQVAKDLVAAYRAGDTGALQRLTDRWLRRPDAEELWEIGGITDAGVAALAGLPRLREVSIAGSPGVTRAALAMFPVAVRVAFRV